MLYWHPNFRKISKNEANYQRGDREGDHLTFCIQISVKSPKNEVNFKEGKHFTSKHPQNLPKMRQITRVEVNFKNVQTPFLGSSAIFKIYIPIFRKKKLSVSMYIQMPSDDICTYKIRLT